MLIRGKNYDINSIVEEIDINSNIPLKRKNGLILRNSQIEVLNFYKINYENFSTINALINEIETVLDSEDSDMEDLEQVSLELSEMNYYNYTHKWLINVFI